MTAQSTVLFSTHLGEIEWDRTSELFLPGGLPGFEDEHNMVPVEIPAHRPLVFLQSLKNPDVCFVSLPVLTICPDFRLRLTEEDCGTLLLEPAKEPVIGEDVLCLALMVPCGDTIQANLSAPIVINLNNFRCLQALSSDVRVSYYRLGATGRWEALC